MSDSTTLPPSVQPTTLFDALCAATMHGDDGAAAALADYADEAEISLIGAAKHLAAAARAKAANSTPYAVHRALCAVRGRTASDTRTGRLRARTVCAETVALDCALAQREKGAWRAVVRDGGDVANSYGYRAYTEAVLAVCDPQGRVVVWAAQLAANKVTSSGAAGACLLPAWALFDGRTGAARKAAAWEAVREAHRAAVAAGDVYLVCHAPHAATGTA